MAVQSLVDRALADGRSARIVVTDAETGDLAVDPPSADAAAGLAARRQSVVGYPWTWLHQVHGAEVVTVDRPGAAAGAEADAAVTTCSGAALSVQTADCAPIGLVAGSGVVGVAHAGWRGLAAGVVGATVATMRDLHGDRIDAVVGPCIHPCCYEFGAEDLEGVAAAVGTAVRSTTPDGRPALDLPAGVRAALEDAGVTTVEGPATCTGCSTTSYSHRVRADSARQALVAWIEP